MSDTYRGKSAQWWAESCESLIGSNNMVTRALMRERARLAAIRLLLNQREQMEELHLMFDGTPVPSNITPAELRTILDDPMPYLDGTDD